MRARQIRHKRGMGSEGRYTEMEITILASGSTIGIMGLESKESTRAASRTKANGVQASSLQGAEHSRGDWIFYIINV